MFSPRQQKRRQATNQKNFPCTPAHVASSTGKSRGVPATAKPARPTKKIPTPAVADPEPLRKQTGTAVVTVPVVTNDLRDHFFLKVSFKYMTCTLDIPDLLEQYMEASGSSEQWITVREIRSFFHLDDATGPAFSGFLLKSQYAARWSCRYKVDRIERFRDTLPPYRIVRRYHVRERSVQ